MKSILITGSSQGIGSGIAKHFSKLGYFVYITYLNKEDLAKQTAQELGENCAVIQLDVREEESVKNAFKIVENKTGALDVLVNNAAVDFPSNIETCTYEEWQEITRTKIDGNFLSTKYAIPLLKKSDNPNLIIITSNMHLNVDPDDPAYCVATGAVVAFMKCMALSLSKYGIRTNGVSPSEVRTHSKYWDMMGNDEMWEKIKAGNPMGKLCSPESIAYAIESIVNDPTKFINGAIIDVTGAKHLK